MASRSPTDGRLSAADIAQNTQQCLAELKALTLSNPQSPPGVLVGIGRLGTGKSSCAEDVSGLRGYSHQSLEPGTQKWQLAKVAIEDQKNKPLFIMDTPGFDPTQTGPIFREIARGIQTVLPISQIVGFLYFTGMVPPRFDSLDREVLQVTRAMSGQHYIPSVTFITTFWTADHPPQQASLNAQYDFLKENWRREIEVQELHLYQHGRGYTAEGDVTGSFINWYDPAGRDLMAQHARDMIVRRYCDPNASTPQTVTPTIVREFRRGIPIHETEAGRIIGLQPAPGGGSSPHSNERRREVPGQGNSSAGSGSNTGFNHEQMPDTNSDTSRASQDRPQAPRAPETSGTNILLEGLSWLFRNVEFSANVGGPGGGMPHNMGLGPGGFGPGGFGPGGDMSEGMLFDPNSHMDLMRINGLDYSKAGRARYAAEHGIGGDPFSASWGEAMLQDVRRRYGKGPRG